MEDSFVEENAQNEGLPIRLSILSELTLSGNSYQAYVRVQNAELIKISILLPDKPSLFEICSNSSNCWRATSRTFHVSLSKEHLSELNRAVNTSLGLDVGGVSSACAFTSSNVIAPSTSNLANEEPINDNVLVSLYFSNIREAEKFSTSLVKSELVSSLSGGTKGTNSAVATPSRGKRSRSPPRDDAAKPGKFLFAGTSPPERERESDVVAAPDTASDLLGSSLSASTTNVALGVPVAGRVSCSTDPASLLAPGGSEGNEASVAEACPLGTRSNHFDVKTDRSSSDLYFHYYGMIMHQQNMLQDYQRTGTYWQAILGNAADFVGKVVMDVGAGSGILSLFAAQAGAAHVYAVEASGMARWAAQLVRGNPELASRVTVINAKAEELQLPEGVDRVDVLVSEPMGTMLLNERMLETFLYARDKFLKPGGRMFPQLGRIHAALFSDASLWNEVCEKASFWRQTQFYGVDLSPLFGAAGDSYFAQVVVDAFDPTLLVSSCTSRVIDFGTCPEGELLDLRIPLDLPVLRAAEVHGVAVWFDVLFDGSQAPVWLSTAPGLPVTHWFQQRCLLQTPIRVSTPGTVIKGSLRMRAHSRQSYDVMVSLTAPPLHPGEPQQTCRGTYDLKDPYYRQLTPQGNSYSWWPASATEDANAQAVAAVAASIYEEAAKKQNR